MEFSNDLITINFPAWLLIVGGSLTAFIITFLSIPPIVSLAHSKGLYDIPNGRTSHIQATPYLGGVAVFTGLILSSIIFAAFGFEKDLAYIIAGLVILLFIGLKDDMSMINPYRKLAGQFIASAIIIILANIRIDNFYGTLGLEAISYFPSILFTTFVFIVIINGINLIDGIDGLASGIAIVIATTLGIWFHKAGFIQYSILCFSLCGSLSAFFYFNVFNIKNKIFLGDAGSLMVGLTLSILIIQFLEFQTFSLTYNVGSAPAIAFGILIIPLFDTLRVFALRIMQGRSPFSADRQHIHHLLLDLGYSHLKASIILIFTNILIILLSFSLQYLRSIYLISIQLLIASGLSYLGFLLVKRKRERDLNRNHEARYGKQVSILRERSSDLFNAGDKNNLKKTKKFQFLSNLNI
jgi:UDP-N-acetylmuramyl pentapeptide phosphotransferase/UDP-N-acetylglucosamine-1-phosphate transferase